MSTELCEDLTNASRWRNHFINRLWLIERPAVQGIRSILRKTDPDHPEDMKKSFKRCTELWKAVHKVARPNMMPDEFATAFSTNGFCPTERSVALDHLGTANVDRVSLAYFTEERKKYEREMESLAKDLPAYEWWCSHRGLNALGLAKIIGETGDLKKYANPDKVKKRLGLAPFRGRSGCSWMKTAKKGNGGDFLTKAEWTELGYVPRRRSVIYQIGTSLLMAQRQPMKKGIMDWLESGWAQIYMAEKEKKAEQKKDDPKWMNKEGIPGMRIKMHAQRYMEQQLIIKLWAVWNDCLRVE